LIPPDLREQSVVLYETHDWIVGTPLTAQAAHWWGGRSAWCTASDVAAFEQYNRTAPLIVLVERVTHARWQLHAATGEFRDSRNRRASWRGFVARHAGVASGLMMALGVRHRW